MDVDVYAKTLPGVTVGAKWGRRTWLVGDKGFVWDRPLSKADIKRYGNAAIPQGEILGVRVADLDAKDALLAIAPTGFFTIEHFNGYPAVLIELRLARAADVRHAILDAWRTLATPALEARLATKRTTVKRSTAARVTKRVVTKSPRTEKRTGKRATR